MQPNPPSMPPPPPYAQPVQSDTSAKMVYVLYLASLVVGITSLVGLVMAYLNVGEAAEPLKTHYRFQIRTFWIGLLYGAIGFLLLVVGIGALVFVFVAIWLIVRCVKGLKALDRREPYANPTTWLW